MAITQADSEGLSLADDTNIVQAQNYKESLRSISTDYSSKSSQWYDRDADQLFPGSISIAGDVRMKSPIYGKELCLLSLDGGGVRGLSALLILKRLMDSINPDNPPKPCDYFDMIGGTSTGGLIALMLGRLCMPVDEAIDAYIALAPKIFTKVHHRVTLNGKVQGRFDHAAIEDGVRDLLDEKGYKRDALLKDSSSDGCKTFVCATSKLTSETIVLSNYASRRRGSDLLNITKVWEAARATAAASSFFDPITIGGMEFVDGATPTNNPIGEMWTEAFDMFKEGDNWRLEDNILCLVSIGTGMPAIKPFGDDPVKLGKALLAIATDTEKRAEDFHRHHSRMAQDGRYFRFNVLRGLETVGLEDASKKDQIMACTQKYLQSEAVFSAVETCARMLIGRENLQPIIEAVRRNAAQATTEFNHLRELEEVQEAIRSGSNSLAWFMNTSAYQRWLREEEETGYEYIWYPVTHDSALHRHQNVVAALCYHILQQTTPGGHPTYDIFYVRFTNMIAIHNAQTPIRAPRLEDIFANLVSQVLVTYDDIRKNILSLPRSYRNGLRQLFNKSQSVDEDMLVNLLLGCLRQMDILNKTQAKTRKPKIIALECAEDIMQVTASRLAFKVARLSGSTRLLVSSKSSGVGEFESWRGNKIDETTECTECLESLQFETMFARREQVVHAESGTNEWVWSYDPYVEWMREASGILWIQGKPGSGKSVLAKTILGRFSTMSNTQHRIIADWFYNARGGERSTSHIYMLRAILFQILKQNRSLFRCYQDAYRSPKWLDSLADVLLRIAGGGPDIPPVICIIDAMDESSDDSTTRPVDLHRYPKTLENMLALLLDIVNAPGSSFKLLILSRPNHSIEKRLKYYHKVALNYVNTGDIEIVVDAGLRSLRRAIAVFDSSDEEEQSEHTYRRQRPTHRRKHLPLSESSSSTKKASSSRIFKKSRESEEEEISSIRDYLLSNAQGVVLWVTLITKDLLRHVEKGMFTFQELKKILDGLPLELHGLYCRITNDLRMSSSELDQLKARRILLWVIGASQARLLKLQELLDALAITWSLDEALQSTKDPITSNRPQVRSWNHFRRSIHELCGPFIEVIRPASHLCDELFDDFEVEPTFLVQITHQTAKDFLTSRDAQNFQVSVSEAEDEVRQDKIKYMRVTLPKIPTCYMPKIEVADAELVRNVEELAQYFEQKLLLEYVFATLPQEVCRKHLFQLLENTTAASELRRPSLWELIAKHPFGDIDIVKSTHNIVGAYFWVAIKAGLVTAVENILVIISTADWWRIFHRHIVANAALLAAVEYGMLDEVQSLLRRHPDGDQFLAANASLLDRAAQTGIEEIAMCIYDKAACGSGNSISERNSFLAQVQKVKKVPIGMRADVEEVREAIRATMIR